MSKVIKEFISSINEVDKKVSIAMQDKLDCLAKPVRGLGRLEELGCQLAAIQKTTDLKLENKTLLVFAADHGVSIEGVSATPKCVTYLQACNTVKNKTTVAALAMVSQAKIKVVDVGIDADCEDVRIINRKIAYGTNNLLKDSAMSYTDAIKSIEIGIEIAQQTINEGSNVVALGELGIGNTTPSAAIISLYTNSPVKNIVGKGSNISEERLKSKVDVVEKSLERHQPDCDNPIDVLAKVGGFEIGAKVGAMIACASNNVPIIIDGFISYSAAILACQLSPNVHGYLIASHQSAEQGSQIAIDYLKLKPYLHLDLCVGEGTGSAIMFNLVNCIDSVLKNMATLKELNVVFEH